MTQFSPFPLHVLSFLYSGKTVTLLNQPGVDVDMNRDLYRHIIESTETRMKERHFKYATTGAFAQVAPPVVKARTRMKSRKTTIFKESREVTLETKKPALEVHEDSESEVEVVTPPKSPPLEPFHPSQRLLDFLKRDSHNKSKSLGVMNLPRLNLASKSALRHETARSSPGKKTDRSRRLKKNPSERWSIPRQGSVTPFSGLRKAPVAPRKSMDFVSVDILGL